MSKLQTKIPINTWVVASWDEYIQAIEEPQLEKAKGYYYNGQLRIEMSPVGSDHASDHAIMIFAVTLFATIKGIPLNGQDNCTLRKTGVQESQPDVSYYIGENADVIPSETSIINLDQCPPPDLVIEIANTSLSDDIGQKRLLYEDLGVAEYWVVDVVNIRIIAFTITSAGGSQRITESQVLPGLAISVLVEALERSRQENQSLVGAWLLSQFQQ
ncbi:Uma2 family endonuclease [Funiculus sociatus GB2-A5]|uniref:Uma2 family endonuclease n=1 Tax=Funiculus sociatus GB2-A5 TaxID=2933946 RepID=A0ABV0JHL2_9CYAN|nr:Uma2 family endonuclease [Trichocoleus sp. FACHB-6]MBD2064362.1 Uma2 family endonuclease [Trichocoleus sp. FACHB-6]